MASIVNDRDILLQAASVRVTSVEGADLIISASASGFQVNNNVATPASITLTAIREGILASAGSVTFTVVEGYVGTLSQNGDQCTVLYQGLVDANSDTCTIRASITYLGKTYTVDSIISGRVTKPSQVQNISSSTSGTYVQLVWNRNPEIDVNGYEVRGGDSGWGDQSVLYRGNANGVLLPATTNSTTWYIKAYNTSNLYSDIASSYTFTPDALPVINSAGITVEIEYISVTNNVATVTWPKQTTQFLIDKYLVKVNKPIIGEVIYETSNNSIDIPADWEGTALVSVATRDVLGQVSSYSNTVSFNKNVPNTPAAPTVSIIGGRISIVWAEVEKTTLPVVGYELRTSNSNWGNKSSFLALWSGSATSTTITPTAADVLTTYYLAAFDTDGKYSAPVSFSYTVLHPNNVSGVTYSYSSTSVGQASCTIKWTRPTITTFALKRYQLRLVKPGPVEEITDTLSTEWTINADWEGTATLYVKVVDILDGESSESQTSIIKVAPGQINVATKTVDYIDTNVKVTWTAPTVGSLPIAGYEIRAANNITVLYKNVYNNYTFPKTQFTTPGNNTYYIYAYDNAYKYGTAQAMTVTLSRPPVVTTGSAPQYSINTLGQPIVTVYWNTPTGSTFNIAYYRLVFTKPGFSAITVNSISNAHDFAADWLGTATLTITTYDVLGIASASDYSTNVIKVAPTAVTSAITKYIDTTISDDRIKLSWDAPVNAGSLPIIAYRLYNSDGSIFIAETSDTSILITREYYTDGTNNYRLFSKDLGGKLSTTYKAVSIVVNKPGTPTNGAAYFTSSTARFTWEPPTTSDFKVVEYIVSLSGAFSTVAARRNTTDWEITVPDNWSNSTGTLSVIAVDAAGFQSTTALPITLTNELPQTPALPTVLDIFGRDVEFDWADNVKTTTRLAISEYKIYNSTKTNLIWKGSVSLARITLPQNTLGQINYKLFAYDYNGNECSVGRDFSYTIVAPTAPTLPVTTHVFGTDTSNSALSLFWNRPTVIHGVYGYEIEYDSTTIFTSSNTIIINPLPSGWVNTNKTFKIRTLDNLLNASIDTNIVVYKAAPNPIEESAFSIQVVDNNVLLYWSLPAITTLPIAGTRIRKQQEGKSPESVGDKTGTFTSVFERQGGVYTYWLSIVDSDGQVSTEIQKDTQVSEPPDFIFNGAITSLFDSVDSANAYTEPSGLTMPVDLLTTWQNHFINAEDGPGGNTWASPQAQVTAGYPVYIQPSTSSGYYREDFNFGTVFSSSKVSVNTTSEIIYGNPTVVTTISVSDDNVVWTAPYVGTSLFATNFQYVRVEINVSVSGVDTGKGLYKLTSLEIVLDSKAISDSGSVSVTTVTDGDIVNFGKQFIDVISINLTPNTSSPGPAFAMYDFVDSVVTGTYTVTSNIATINTGPTEHGLKPGQNVRLSFVTGNAPAGVYTVVSELSSTSYTVAITTANTSGNVSTYAQGMRVFLYNLSGLRETGSISWSVSGY